MQAFNLWDVKKNICFFWGMLTACFCCHGWHHQLLPWANQWAVLGNSKNKRFKWGCFCVKGFLFASGVACLFSTFQNTTLNLLLTVPDLTSTYELLMNSYGPHPLAILDPCRFCQGTQRGRRPARPPWRVTCCGVFRRCIRRCSKSL